MDELAAAPSDTPGREGSSFAYNEEKELEHQRLWFFAVENERKRVAKELHDEILPSFARLTRNVEANCRTQIAEILVNELHATVASFRDLLGELHPVDLEELGLLAALDNICRRYSRKSGLCIIFIETIIELELDKLQALCIYRAMQLVLRMFVSSENDILTVRCARAGEENLISVRCIDRHVSSAAWLSWAREDFVFFEDCIAIAGAEFELDSRRNEEFPCDLLLYARKASKGQSVCNRFCKQEHPDLELANQALTTERQKIEKDIDTLIMPYFERLKKLSTACEPAFKREFNERLQEISRSLRAMISEFHPPLLFKLGFSNSIASLLEGFRLSSKIETSLQCDLASENTSLSQEAQFEIYRVVQEALNNIEKHAGASLVRVSINQIADRLILRIEDNGRGFQQNGNILSRGIKNMKERAREIGASLSIQPALSFKNGTMVSLKLRTDRTC